MITNDMYETLEPPAITNWMQSLVILKTLVLFEREVIKHMTIDASVNGRCRVSWHAKDGQVEAQPPGKDDS